jgi:hypothetical protein
LRSLRNLSARAGSAAIAALLAAAAGPAIGTAHADEGLSLDDHLVLSYEFEAEGVADGTVTDVSSSGLDGELVNAAAAQIVDGRVAGTGALELSGGAADSTTAPFVQIPRGVFTGRTEASIATWVRWDGGADFQWIYNLGRDNAHATFLTPSFQGDGRTRSSIKPVNGSTEVGVPGAGKLPTGTWVQAVTTVDGADIVYYLNGVEVGRRAAAVDLAATMDAGDATTSGRIGRALWDGHPYFDGAIDDFRVYDIALDATQVAGLYGEPLPTVEAVGRTQFDVTTSTGQAPKLPATTDATFTDGIGRSVPITWEAVDPQQYAGRGQFTVSGTVTGTGTAVSATVTVRTPGVVEVDLGQETGDFLGGASGTLYGLYDQGLPSNNLVDGIKLKTVATKAQDGPQHPGADALEVLEPIVDSSDGDVYIYMTDIHRGFPYEWPGDTPEEKLSTYLEKIRLQAEQVRTMPLEYQDNVVFMPYNEPEGNMFGTGEWSYDGTSWLDDPQDFYEAWDRAYAEIRAVLPDARIGGPNTSILYNQVRGFLQHTVEAGTVPSAMVWHELSNPASIRTNVAKYRTWEREVFAGTEHEGTELPINITEYAYNYHTSVPGQMIQWVSALEDAKVYGDIAYWNIDGNLSDSAVQANRANGQWWLLNSYSQMTGRTVKVTPPQPDVSYTLQGVATLDTAKKQSRVIIGGADGTATIALDNIPADVFGDRVHVAVREIAWSGQIGDSAQPPVIGELDLDVEAGSTEVPFDGSALPQLDAESAYEVVISPSVSPGATTAAPTVWDATFEAEAAAHTGEGWSKNGPEGSPSSVAKFYTSGGYDVGGLRTGSNVTLDFTVDVPQDGTYDLSVFANSLNTYDAVQAQGPTNVFLRVDGRQDTEQELHLPLGYKWVVWDHVDTTVDLTQGKHVLTLAARSLDGQRSTTGDAIVDKIDLSLANAAYTADVYEAETAELSGASAPRYEGEVASGAGAASVPAGGTATFWTYWPDDSGAALKVDNVGGGPVEVAINGEQLTTGQDGSLDVFLRGGINKITVHGEDGLVVDRLTTTRSEALHSATYEAEDADVAGSAHPVGLSLASGGAAVAGIGGEPGNTNTLTFAGVEVAQAGRYALTFRYSNEEQSPSTHYNPDPIARYAYISVNGGEAQRVVFPHSFHENNFWELSVPTDLVAGANTITVSGREKPQFDGQTLASDGWPGVPLRSQYAPNIDNLRVTALAPGKPTLPAWDPAATYTEGDEVMHDGATWMASWWTRNQEPGASPWGPWQELPQAGPDGIAPWASTRIYDKGDTVSYDGAVFTAKWWTRHQPPGDPNGPWEPRR